MRISDWSSDVCSSDLRWLSPCAERTSVRTMPCELSCNSFTLAGTIGLVKLGQPQPDSNLSEEANSGSPETMSTQRPASLLSLYSPVKGRSVALSWVTRYCSGVNLRSAPPRSEESSLGTEG